MLPEKSLVSEAANFCTKRKAIDFNIVKIYTGSEKSPTQEKSQAIVLPFAKNFLNSAKIKAMGFCT